MALKKVFKLTWVVLSIVSAFVIGLNFKPGTPAGKRRIPPALNMQQFQQRMPQRMPQSGYPTQQMMPRGPSQQNPYKFNR